MSATMNEETTKALHEYVLRLGDDRLTLGHRLSEWCGHGPILEEDLAITNVALDLVGQASNFLKLAAELGGEELTADQLAYFRDDTDFHNIQLTELPRGDYAFTVARLFLFSAFSYHLFSELQNCAHEDLAGLAAKALKETKYHLRHSGQWMLRMGDGTEESHRRSQTAINELWMYTGEMFEVDSIDEHLIKNGLVPDVKPIREEWHRTVSGIIEQATLKKPDDDIWMASGGRRGFHTEHLGHMLTEMQILARSHPGAKW